MVDQSKQVPKVVNYMKSPTQGAATSVYAALGAEWANKGGKYLSNCVVQDHVGDGGVMSIGDDGYETWAYEPESEAKLWKFSLKALGIADDQ